MQWLELRDTSPEKVLTRRHFFSIMKMSCNLEYLCCWILKCFIHMDIDYTGQPWRASFSFVFTVILMGVATYWASYYVKHLIHAVLNPSSHHNHVMIIPTTKMRKLGITEVLVLLGWCNQSPTMFGKLRCCVLSVLSSRQFVTHASKQMKM